MKSVSSHKPILRAILEGTYTPYDVREFVQLCYALALPLIRSKISRGKLNLESLGLKEVDLVYDCLADLFRRDSEGSFVQVKSFFANHELDLNTCRDEEVLLALRRIVFGKVHNSVIRLYSDLDPALGKILRNVLLDVEKTELFRLEARFGEMCLVPQSGDPRFHLPPMNAAYLRQVFSQMVSVRDQIPVMLRKLHQGLLMQEEYQRAVPLVMAALLFKEACTLGAEAAEAETDTFEQQAVKEDVGRVADEVCHELSVRVGSSYVRKGKRTEKELRSYMVVVKDVLLSEFGATDSGDASYYSHLVALIPDLTKASYAKRHRAVLEYLAKRAKKEMVKKLRRL